MLAWLARALVFFSGVARLVLASSSSEQDHFMHVQWDDDNWTIYTHVLKQGHYQSRLTLANVYFGINVASAGPFFEVDEPLDGNIISGWPLFGRRQTFFTIAGSCNSQPRTHGTNYPWLYQYGWESFVAGIPHRSRLQVKANGDLLNASVNSDYITDFDFSLEVKAGIASWRYNWPGGSGGCIIDLNYQLFVHQLYVNTAACRLRLTTHNKNVTVYDVLDGDCAVRSDFIAKKYEEDWASARFQ